MRKKGYQPGLFQYVFDTSSLINIERLKKMEHLRKRIGEIIIPEKVAEEINHPGKPLSNLVQKHPHVVAKFNGREEEEEYLRILRLPGMDPGEAAAIVIALRRKLPLVVDDKVGKATAKNYGLQTLSWKDFINGAIPVRER
jgi:predicted nucleic acid-binding protein